MRLTYWYLLSVATAYEMSLLALYALGQALSSERAGIPLEVPLGQKPGH